VRKEEITHLCGECAGPCPGHLGCEVEEGCYRLDASEGYKCAALTGWVQNYTSYVLPSILSYRQDLVWGVR